MQRLRVISERFPYDVLVGRGAWRFLGELPPQDYTSVFVLTERALWNRWGKPFLRASGLERARALLVPAGENSKSVRMVERVASQLLRFGADRKSLLIALGGGVVGDLGGFVASTYMRGIDCVQVPTTVVGQVDSAIGGKTAVNVGAMKNLIGTIYPPRQVLADPLVLATLGERAFRSGLYEVVKHALLAGAAFFDQLDAHLDSLRARQLKTLELILPRAAKVKVDVVNRDEAESGRRRILNLGHTFGHALEGATRYQRFLHGEAVGWGLLAATRLAQRLGMIKTPDAEKIMRLVLRVGPLPPIRDLAPAKILKLLPRDKKAIGGQIHWVIPERVGKVRIVADVSPVLVAAAFEDVRQGRWA